VNACEKLKFYSQGEQKIYSILTDLVTGLILALFSLQAYLA